MSAMVPHAYTSSPEELRAFVLAQVERLEATVAPLRTARHDDPADTDQHRREELELRVATLEDRTQVGRR